MQNTLNKKHDTIRTVCKLIAEHQPPAQVNNLQQLAKQYFSEIMPRELLRSTATDLYGAITSLWHHVYQRSRSGCNIKIYNPSHAEHLWQSSHTVIDIVCDDSPFLVSSITNALAQLEYKIHRNTHPIIAIKRYPEGNIKQIYEFAGRCQNTPLEAVMRFEIDRESNENKIRVITTTLRNVIRDVHRVVKDWQAMRGQLIKVIEDTDNQQLPINKEDKEECLAFLRWLVDSHFTFIGYQSYDLVADKINDLYQLSVIKESGLGSLKERYGNAGSLEAIKLNPCQLKLAREPKLLVMTKSSKRSTVQRLVNLDYLGVKRFDAKGQVIGEDRFYGLYSSAAYTAKIDQIPLLRRKVEVLINRIQILPNSHKCRSLQNVLNYFPRDEMLQASVDELLPMIQGILETQELHQLRLFIRIDTYGHFVTALVYIPRERFNTQLRIHMQQILLQEFNGQSTDFRVLFSEQPLVRVHFTVHGKQMNNRIFRLEDIEQQMRDAMLSWEDHLLQILQSKHMEARGNVLFKKYKQSFPVAYKDHFSPQVAAVDILRLEQISTTAILSTYLYRAKDQPEMTFSFKIFGKGQPRTLSEVLPILEHMGVKVIHAHPYVIHQTGSLGQWIIDFVITIDTNVSLEGYAIKERFQEAFNQVYQGQVDDDSYNQLVLLAGLNWREVTLIRAIGKYLSQIQVPFSQAYMQETLAGNAQLTRSLMHLFDARFNPDETADEQRQSLLLDSIHQTLDQVKNLDEDRIIKHFLTIIQSMLRCNYYQTDINGSTPDYLAFKLDPCQIPGMPLPVPKYEIFVYATWVEGVHLRGGKIARGGLRWSDRKEDYRTEVLGLVKAQMVKNSVIVPVGAKGGFICKQLAQNSNQEIRIKAAVRSYSTFIQALLDLTDNLVNQQVKAPANLVCYDDSDPYLVVAADKGTASFSNIANKIALHHGFWLGDAFASGGANGYDHKKMGITAQGAWKSVEYLFMELDRDIQKEDFTVLAIGDMSGDVFGNGMLLSPHIHLQAAFNHQHIFIDPLPNASLSLAERQRLFELPHSSWADYNTGLISKGGGIFSRGAKSIRLSMEMVHMLQTDANRLTPNELIQKLLQMPVDLLWNGGIGTYVKASSESHANIGDPANDSVRINGNQLGCKIVGEGGNLGLSQAGRIEFAEHGGLINTDAIDNSGGVDCSDHEVNIKILLNQLVTNGDMTLKQRNELLASMTNEVAQLVLANNHYQSQVLSIANSHADKDLDNHIRLIHCLEQEGSLNRTLEYLPDDATLAERSRQHRGLTRPEIAILLAYSKMRLFDQLNTASISNDPYFHQMLLEYFPSQLRRNYAIALNKHPLRQEIIATHLTNTVINGMGSTFCHSISDESGADTTDVVRAFFAAREIMNIESLWHELDQFAMALDHRQLLTLQQNIQNLVKDTTLWLLQHQRSITIKTMVTTCKPAVSALLKQLDQHLDANTLIQFDKCSQPLTAVGIEPNTSNQLACLNYCYHGLHIALTAQQSQMALEPIINTWFGLYHLLELNWLTRAIHNLSAHDAWQRKARFGLKQELETSLRQLTILALKDHDGVFNTEDWKLCHQNMFSRCSDLFAKLKRSQQIDLAMLSVAVREVAKLHS